MLHKTIQFSPDEKEGFDTFVLHYSVGEYSEFPNPLEKV